MFESIRLLSSQPLGRSLSWNYFRDNFEKLEYEMKDDMRLGTMLEDISRTFESEFLFHELLTFIFAHSLPVTSRYVTTEHSSINILWLFNRESEIAAAFNLFRGASTDGVEVINKTKNLDKIKKFTMRVREELMKF